MAKFNDLFWNLYMAFLGFVHHENSGVFVQAKTLSPKERKEWKRKWAHYKKEDPSSQEAGDLLSKLVPPKR